MPQAKEESRKQWRGPQNRIPGRNAVTRISDVEIADQQKESPVKPAGVQAVDQWQPQASPHSAGAAPNSGRCDAEVR
jgi:hypothetical protein